MEVPRPIPPLAEELARHPSDTIDSIDTELSVRQLFEQLNQQIPEQLSARKRVYFMLMGLGARASRECYITRRRETEPLHGIPIHQIYHTMLQRTLAAGRLAIDPELAEQDPVFSAIYGDIYGAYRRSGRRFSTITPAHFSNIIDSVLALKKQFFDGLADLTEDGRATLITYDLAVRISSERQFVSAAEPYVKPDGHLPADFAPPDVLIPFIEPTYFRYGGSLLGSNTQFAKVGNEAMQAWLQDEYHHWSYPD